MDVGLTNCGEGTSKVMGVVEQGHEGFIFINFSRQNIPPSRSRVSNGQEPDGTLRPVSSTNAALRRQTEHRR